ncbi:hypothetical protein TraAM80_05757 [Trypanosoma rangeli]|uniref:Tetraspanin n=1 Tax=Trypanosoma rangeli TaxID=5698 RepID=A0A422NDS8_TRYRA|nr:uncharacterized protein TraAM80_05757 [Trypanosoma rangeli]RNF03596.1 hypothetical protein TraAM80_05757 [Trypanosoma rangeli]|eukprot:RNF03596.1 hypothetical protein TraAM80_05757 [Trypanosoma rangeli]
MKLLGTSTAEKEQMQLIDMYVPDEEVDWTSDAYIRPNGDERSHRACDDCPAHRILTACFSTLLIIIGVAAFIFVAVVGSLPEQMGLHLNCTTLFFFLVCPGIFFLFVGLVGVVSAWRETQFASVLFSVLVAIPAFVLLEAGMLLLVVYLKVVSSNFLADVWELAVPRAPDVICEFQERLQCSGFAPSQCCVSNLTAAGLPNVSSCYLVAEDGVTTLDPHTLQPVSWPSRVCAPTCVSSNVYNATCQERFENLCRKMLPPSCGGFFAVGFVFLGFGVLACYRVTGKRIQDILPSVRL